MPIDRGPLRALVLALASSVPLVLLLAGIQACSASSAPATSPPGLDCSSLVVPQTCPSPPPSWKSDVAPLLEAYCLQCHGAGAIASARFPLSTYADVKQHATQSWEQVYTCLMPNGDASPPPLAYPTLAQRQTLVTWASVCGAPNN